MMKLYRIIALCVVALMLACSGVSFAQDGVYRIIGEKPMFKFFEALKTDRSVLLAEVRTGKSLDEIAAKYGEDVPQLKNYAVEYFSGVIERANTLGELTDEETHELKQTLPQRIDRAAKKPGLLNLKQKRESIALAAACTLNMNVDDMRASLATGQSFKELAQSRNVPLSAVTGAMKKELNVHIEELVADDIIPDYVAYKVKAKAAARIDKIAISKRFGQFMKANIDKDLPFLTSSLR